MTTEMHVENVPPGRKVRAVKICPWWCRLDDTQHVENGDEVHYSHDVTDQAGAMEVYLATAPDGTAPTVRAGLVTGRQTDWEWTPDQAQAFINDLQAVVDTARGATPDQHPPGRDEAVGRRDDLQERVDAAVLAFRALGNAPVNDGPRLWLQCSQILAVLAGSAPTDAIVHPAPLAVWAGLSRQVEGFRAGLDELGEAFDDGQVLIKQLMDLEDHRRGIATLNVLHPDMQRQ